MSWDKIYRIRSYLRSSLWVVPFFAIPLELVITRVVHWLDRTLGWSVLDFTPEGAQALFQAIVSATLTFVVFTFGSLLVAIQVASSQLTARIIATTLLRNPLVKYIVGLFIFTFLFAVSAQGRGTTNVHQFVAFVAACLGVLCFAMFFYLIDYALRFLRPISVLQCVGVDGITVIDSVYPDPGVGPDAPASRHHTPDAPDRTVAHRGTSEIILAVNEKALVALAQKGNCTIEVVPQVGDFVAADEPLFRIFGDPERVTESGLRTAVAFGSERTLEQDPTFAFRIIVDIALRALSPAINDPTTGVIAIDQLHRLLRMVGKRHLRTDEIRDNSGRLCVVFRTPNWEDFVHLAFSEIRFCGSNNLQIVRRLRAMIENLIQTLPKHRHPALLEQLGLLEREIEKHFKYSEDIALARVADSQGLGGNAGRQIGTENE